MDKKIQMRFYKNKTRCRISGSKNLVEILSLGDQPLANSLKANDIDHEERVPLTLLYCPESSLLQLKETVNKEILFNHYIWITGTSSTALKYADVFCQRVINITNLKPNDLIIEIASNDGTFLMPFIKNGYTNVIGVDPAKNIAEIATKNGVNTLSEFWSEKISENIVSKYGNAKVVFARNVIPHVSELLDVIVGIENAMQDEGVGIIEFHNAGGIIKGLQYDSIYHEHICYFSIKSITYLLKKFNLFPFHIDESPIGGGCFVIYFSKNNRIPSDELVQLTENEQKDRINDLESWLKFAERCKEHKKKTLDIISSLKDKTIVGFGSSARSQTYLNYCEVNSSQIKAIIDNNPLKQGLFTPGSSIPIISFKKGMQMNPDIIFILAWNFKDEIVNECRTYGFKDKFLVPFPNEPYFI